MMKFYLLVSFLFIATIGYAQDISSNYREKKVALQDTVVLDSVSINPKRFAILDKDGNSPNPFSYRVDFKKGIIIFSEELQQQQDSLTIQYLRYPDFLTRDYFALDPKIIVENTCKIDKLYSLQESTNQHTFTPFDGLNTSGSISRGISIGNNQNAVVNSELDLQ